MSEKLVSDKKRIQPAEKAVSKKKNLVLAKKSIKISWPGGMIKIAEGDDCSKYSENIKSRLISNGVIDK